MELVGVLYGVLASGAALMASSAAGEFAKSAAAFGALMARLSGEHGVQTLGLLDPAADKPAFAEAVKADLAKPEIAGDAEVLRLAETLREAIASLPAETQARYAVDIETIRSGGALLFEANEGVRAKLATSEGDMTFRGNKALRGK